MILVVNSPKVKKGLGIVSMVLGVLQVVLAPMVYGPGNRLVPILSILTGIWFIVMVYLLVTDKWGKTV